MQIQEIRDKISTYLRGTADEESSHQVESWFSEGENNQPLMDCLHDDWEMITDEEGSNINLDHLLHKIHHQIRLNESIAGQLTLRKLIRTYSKVAAALLLPVLLIAGIGFSYLRSAYHTDKNPETNTTLYAPMGSRVSFRLPDGTSGMLNSGSRLTYTLPFSDRSVKFEGEGWFDVVHDEKHPFSINTANSVVKVLGTKFNLSSYPSEKYTEVVLQQGVIEFMNKSNDLKTIMRPSERLVLQDGTTNISTADTAKYSAWTRGQLVFRGDLMAEVARRIERWYNVKIRLADKELEKYSFRATFEDDKIEDVLHILSLTSPIEYKISPSRLMADGTFEKEVVTISLKK